MAVLREDRDSVPLYWAIRDLPALKGEASNWRVKRWETGSPCSLAARTD